MKNSRIAVLGLFCLATLACLLLASPAESSIQVNKQITSIGVTIYVGTTPAPTTTPTGATGSETINASIGATAPQYVLPSTKNIVFVGNAGQTVTNTCAATVWISPNQPSSLETGLDTNFSNISGGTASIPSTAFEMQVPPPSPSASPAPIYTPVINFTSDGKVWAGLGSFPEHEAPFCLNTEFKIPSSTPSGVYYAVLAISYFSASSGTPATPPAATPSPTPTPTPVAYIYTAPFIGSQNDIYAFTVGSNGNVAPASIITTTTDGPVGVPDFANPMDITTAPNGDVIVAAEANSELVVLSPDPLGSVTPIATITNSLFSYPDAVGTDSGGNIYVLQGTTNNWTTAAIMEFPGNANGDVSAEYQIPSNLNGIATAPGSLSNPSDIAITQAGTIYATSNYWNGPSLAAEVVAFANGANGPTASPIATIAGSNTDIGGDACSVALDAQSNIYVLARDDSNACPTINTSGPLPTNIRIVVYPAGSNGNVAPSAVISGGNTMLTNPNKIRVDASGNIYVADLGVGGILFFAAGSNGNVAPTAIISGSDTGLGINNIQFVGL